MKAALEPFRRRLVLAEGTIALAWALLACAALAAAAAAADAFLALPLAARLAAMAIVAGVPAILVGRGLVRALSTSPDRIAWLLDRAAGRKDHGLLSALQLSRQAAGGELQAGLIQVQAASVRAELARLDRRVLVPRDRLRRASRWAIGSWGAAALLGLAFRGPLAEVLPRFLDPLGDHPPYSPLKFEIDPSSPAVEYGGTVKLTALVSGGRVESLALHTRDETGAQEAPCFRGQQGEFSQRIENVTRPLTFWFSTGKSRSHFCRVLLLLTPRLTGLQATVRAPAYARLAPQVVNPGLEPIRGLVGSEVELVARSNRPLLGGELLCQAADGSARSSVRGVPAGSAGENAVRFRWRLDRPAALGVRLLDVDGNPSRPVLLRQELVPDRPPEVTIGEPAQVGRATPESKIPLAAAASDDYGLARLALVRSLKGFRDRERRVELPLEPPRNHAVSAEFDFADLGVSPGDEVEFFLEAQDTNPSGMGMGSSSVGRIVIISREQYLELERARARLEDFRNRYRAIAERVRGLADGTQEARELMRQGRDREAEKRLAELQSSARGLAAYLKLHSTLVPLYDVEAEYQRELAVLRKEVEEAAKKLDAKDLEAAAAALKAGAQEYAGVMDSVEFLAEASEVLAMQAEFMRLYQIQKDAAARFRRFEQPGGPAGERKQTLEALAGIEARTAKELGDFVKELRRRAEKLPAETPELKKSALAFAEQVEKEEIGKDLEAAAGYARAGAGAEASGRAQLAVEKMTKLIGQCDGAGSPGGGWCRDPRFRPVDRSSLRQMLAGQGLGLGTGLGQGAGSGSGDGYSMSSHTLDNVQAYGPGTTGALSPRSGGPGAPSPAGEPGKARVVRGGAAALATGTTRGFRFNAAAGFPERYRQELIEYFQLIGRLAAEEDK